MAARRLAESIGAARGPPRWFGVLFRLVRHGGLGIRRVSRVLLDAANEIKRGVERLVILRIRRDVGLRAGLLVAFGLEVAAQRSLAAGVGARFELFRHVLQQSATELAFDPTQSDASSP